MRRQRLLLFLSAVVSVTLWTYACGDGTTEPPPYFPEPTTVTVSPATAELAALGATVQLSAQVQDQNGQVMSSLAEQLRNYWVQIRRMQRSRAGSCGRVWRWSSRLTPMACSTPASG